MARMASLKMAIALITAVSMSALVSTSAGPAAPVEDGPKSGAVRSFGSLHYTPRVPLTVRYKIVIAKKVNAYGMEDRPPAGWTNITEISHDGAYDARNHLVKWFFFDSVERSVTYRVLPPGNASGEQSFEGRVAFSRNPIAIGGDSSISNSAPAAAAAE